MRSLRTKLTIANILPILLLTPLLSLFLLYTLEGFFTDKLLQRLAQQAELLLNQVEEQPQLVAAPQAAQRFLREISSMTDARVILLSRTGELLGSTRIEDQTRIGAHFLAPSVTQALRGAVAEGVESGFTAEVAYIALPVRLQGEIAGVLRLSYEVDDVRTQFRQLRWLVLGGTGATTILGLALGLGLATTITSPLRQLTGRVQEIAAGKYDARVAIQREDEVGLLARSFNQMAARLEEAEATRQQQLAAIIHEVARPLTGMHAAVETLLDGAAADEEMRLLLLTGLEDELARLERLISTLQNLHKHVLQPLQLNCIALSLERVIRASVANFEPAAAQLGVTLAIELPAQLPPAYADEDRMIQVLTNLVDNALKFTPRGGKITVAASEQSAGLWVTVTDTGVGIAPTELPYLFQQFYRGAESRPPEKRGMGLGLTICREIINAHGGKIWVESKPGRGARFTFTLPKA